VQPRKVLQATINLRTVSDVVGLFLAKESTFEAGAKISRTAFREMLEKWCEEEGIRYPPPARKVVVILKENGGTYGGRSNGDRFWSGIRLKTGAERDDFEKAQSVQRSLVVI
jgi:hypothetical protein